MFVTAFLSLAGLGFICWLLFNLAVYALPFFVGVSAGLLAYDSGAGPLAAIVVGVVAGASALVMGQVLFANLRHPFARAVVALLFAGPAALAGYHAVLGLASAGAMAEPWAQVFGAFGAMTIGVIAWSRISLWQAKSVHPATVIEPTVAPLGAGNDR